MKGNGAKGRNRGGHLQQLAALSASGGSWYDGKARDNGKQQTDVLPYFNCIVYVATRETDRATPSRPIGEQAVLKPELSNSLS